MPDITAITSILSSVKTASEIAKLLKETDFSLEKAEAKLKVAELIGALADAKMQIAEIRELLVEKEEKIRKLQDELKIKSEILYEKPNYWLKNGEKKDGPFCQTCYDNSNKLVRLQNDEPGYWTCNACRNSFTDCNFNPRQPEGSWRSFT